MTNSLILGLLGAILLTQTQTEPYGKVNIPSLGTAVETGLNTEGPYLSLLPQDEDTFATYAFTFSDAVIFSYEDDAQVEIWDQDRSHLLWSGTLNQDEYIYQMVGQSVFQVISNKEFSILIGDPFVRVDCQGWVAVDQNSRPLSTKLLTAIQGSLPSSYSKSQKFIVFAYNDDTHVRVRNLNNDQMIWEGDLNSLEYRILGPQGQEGVAVSVEADKAVSALSYTDCGYYAPAFNGTFTGRDFITFCGDMGDWAQALKIVPWENNVNVVVTDLDNPDDTLWKINIAKRGDIQEKSLNGRFLKIHADKDISCAMVPAGACYVGYFHLVRSIDRNGLGIGTEFFVPCFQSGTLLAKMDIFSFYDNNQVNIYKWPNLTNPIWSGVLEEGGYHREETFSGEYKGIYKVESSRGIAVIESMGHLAGADFLPLWFAIHPSIAAVPAPQFQETECLVPTQYEINIENNGNALDLINITTFNSRAPEFTTVVFDSLGGQMPDADGNGEPDTDSLSPGKRFQAVVEVTPVTRLPFGTVDTCKFAVVSAQDSTKEDTALLVTTILPVEVHVDSSMEIFAYRGDVAVFNLQAYQKSLYREDDLNFSWTATQPENFWPIWLTDITGNDLTDTDSDGNPDLDDVPTNAVPEPFQVRVGVPDSALAGDQDVIILVVTSANYPADYFYRDSAYIYEEVTDTVFLTVTVLPEPAIRIEPNREGTVDAGSTIRYSLEVSNNGNGPDIPNIDTTLTQPGWNHEFFYYDGNPLQDNNGDPFADLDTLDGSGGFDTIYLDVTAPFNAREDDIDSAIVYARSTVDLLVYDSAIVVTTVGFSTIVDIEIEPDTATIIHPGDSAVYEPLRVSNYGESPDIIRCWTAPLQDLGWDAELTFADGRDLGDTDNDGFDDLGPVGVLETKNLRLVIKPPEEWGKITTLDFDTSVVEQRYVWIQTGFAADTLVRDSALITTVFEPPLDIHNYPNPFSGPTTFVYTIPRRGQVTLRIYNRAGEHIRTLLSDKEIKLGGIFTEHWDGLTEDGKEPSPGVYLYVLEWREQKEDGTYVAFMKRIVKKALLQP
ncbi:hypothetical protein JXM67_15045 [candidate division WOR-3 bacterium]|nr:hypothetical protein [candidate division WOR-3 bacterium]